MFLTINRKFSIDCNQIDYNLLRIPTTIIRMEPGRPTRRNTARAIGRTLRATQITQTKRNALGRALLEAVKADNEDEVRRLSRIPGIDIAYEDSDENNDNRVDVVTLALRRGHISILRTLLRIALEKGLTEIATRLVNIPNPTTGRTPLFSYSLDPTMVRRLLAIPGIDINHRDNEGSTAFNSLCSGKGRSEAIKVFLNDPRVDLNRPNNDGQTPLLGMIYSKYVLVTLELLSKPGININIVHNGYTPLMYACQEKGISRVVLKLLSMPGVNVNHANNQGNTALLIALIHGDTDTVRALCSVQGININHVNHNGWTALLRATSRNNLDRVQLICAVPGVNVNAQLPDRDSALHLAINNEERRIIEILLQQPNINVNLTGHQGLSPLNYSVRTRARDIFSRLLAFPGVDVNIPENDGDTPLINAVRKDCVFMVRRLLEKDGIDIAHRNQNGHTALDIARRDDHREIRRLLEIVGNPSARLFNELDDHNLAELNRLLSMPGINVNVVDGGGSTPLIFAAMTNYMEGANRLLEVPGIDINHQNVDGQTALLGAIGRQHTAMTLRLLTVGVDVNLPNRRGLIALSSALQLNMPSDVIAAIAERTTDINYLDGQAHSPLQYALLSYPNAAQRLQIVRLLLERGANPRIGMDPTPYEEALRRAFAPEFNQLLRRAVPTGVADMWRGFTRGDVALMNDVFRSPDLARHTSFCPVCLAPGEHDRTGCMYVHHNCSAIPNNTYNEALYMMYKGGDGHVQWCTICGRICTQHRHYQLVRADGPRAPLVQNPRGTMGDADCQAQGGGGHNEKLKRMDALRSAAFQLNRQLGRISKHDAKDELVAAAWDAPLTGMTHILERIHGTLNFTVPTRNFPPNVGENGERVYPTILYPDATNPALFPLIVQAVQNAVTYEDVPVGVQFRHRMANGAINQHEGEYVGLDNVFRGLATYPTFGRCWNYNEGRGCTAPLYPQELAYVLDHVEGLTAEQRADYQAMLDTYTRRFNRIFADGFGAEAVAAVAAVGGGNVVVADPDAMFQPAQAICSMPRTTVKSRKTRRRKWR